MKTEPIIDLQCRKHPQALPSTPPSSRDVIPGLRDPFRSRGGITGVTFRVPKQHPVLISIAGFLAIGAAVAGATFALNRPASSPAALYAEPPTVARPAVPPPPPIVALPPVSEPVSAPSASAASAQATPSAQPSASAKPRWVSAPTVPAAAPIDNPYDNASARAPAPASTTIAKPDPTMSAPGTPSPSLGF